MLDICRTPCFTRRHSAVIKATLAQYMSAIYLWFLAKTGRKLGFNIVPILGVTRDIFSVDLQVKVVRNVSSESEIFFSLWLSSKFKKMTYLLYIFLYCNYAREVQFDIYSTSFKANMLQNY